MKENKVDITFSGNIEGFLDGKYKVLTDTIQQLQKENEVEFNDEACEGCGGIILDVEDMEEFLILADLIEAVAVRSSGFNLDEAAATMAYSAGKLIKQYNLDKYEIIKAFKAGLDIDNSHIHSASVNN